MLTPEKDRALRGRNPSSSGLVWQDICGHLSFALARFGCPILPRPLTLAKGKIMSKVDDVVKAFLSDYNDPAISDPHFPDIISAGSNLAADVVFLHGSIIAGYPNKEHAVAVVRSAICLLADFFE